MRWVIIEVDTWLLVDEFGTTIAWVGHNCQYHNHPKVIDHPFEVDIHLDIDDWIAVPILFATTAEARFQVEKALS